MKIQVELNPQLEEEEIIIRCPALTDKIAKMQQVLSGIDHPSGKITLYREEREYYLRLEDILFFQTGLKCIEAHTAKDVFQTRHKLYELEEFLPGYFMRISKSTILNIDKVYAVSRNLTASSLVEFQNTHKQVYVSRNYYRPLKNKLEERHIQKRRFSDETTEI